MMKGFLPAWVRPVRLSWELGFLLESGTTTGFLLLESGTWLSSELGFLLDRGEATGSLER